MGSVSKRGQILLAGAILLLLGTDALMLYLRQPAAPVGANVALERFRSATPEPTNATATPVTEPGGATSAPSTDPAAAPQTTLPAAGAPDPGPAGGQSGASQQPAGPTAPLPPREGVYTYRTTGHESVAAFGGSRHDYPATTYMTVRRKGCGIVLRWQPLEERWDESDHCPQGPNISIDRFAMYHEFFRQGMVQDYACDPGSHVYRADHAAGATWSVRCVSAEFGQILMATRVVGVETVNVGGVARQATRMHYDAQITGYSEGRQVQERWVDQETGLMLRISTTVDVDTQTPVGRTVYHEEYQIDLLSLDPQT